jgi:hypothetical protein
MKKLVVLVVVSLISIVGFGQDIKLTESVRQKQIQESKYITQLFENLNDIYFDDNIKPHLYKHLSLLKCNNKNHQILSSYYSLNNFTPIHRYGSNNLFEEHDLLKDLTDNKIVNVIIDKSDLMSVTRTRSSYNLTINISYESNRLLKNLIIHFYIQNEETMSVTVSDYDDYH